MKIHFNWKKILLIVTDVALAVYIVFAITSWNKPDESNVVCTKVDINIEDESTNGFLNTSEIKTLLTKYHLYPLSQKIADINTRLIEDELLRMPFVKTAQCYITQDGHANITITQRTPIVRVKADNGDDYYIDDAGGVMPNSEYTSDMIIVTGKLTKRYACEYISVLAQTIMDDDFWRNQTEQINVLPDGTIEIIPRVGEHIINFGQLPQNKDKEKRAELIREYVQEKFHYMDIFYRHGLTEAGWTRYSYISLEFANQIVCTKADKKAKVLPPPVEEPKPEENKEEEKTTETATATTTTTTTANQ